MAKKTAPKADLKTAPGLIFVRLQLTEAEHAELRVIAAQDRMPMAIRCREWVSDAIRQRKKKNGK